MVARENLKADVTLRSTTQTALSRAVIVVVVVVVVAAVSALDNSSLARNGAATCPISYSSRAAISFRPSKLGSRFGRSSRGKALFIHSGASLSLFVRTNNFFVSYRGPNEIPRA